MKEDINKFIDWFEDKFNFIIDFLALVGGAFCILLAIYFFIASLITGETPVEPVGRIVIPGILGFFGLLILFALRITRTIAKNKEA